MFHLRLPPAWGYVYRRRRTVFIGLALGVAGVFVLVGLVWFLLLPPSDFPFKEIIAVEEGRNLNQIAEDLARHDLIRMPPLFQAAVTLFGSERGVIAGDYYFEEPESTTQIARRLTRGDFQIEPWKITIPEGSSILRMAEIFGNVIPDFDSDLFLTLAEDQRGYLFPDTYTVTPLTTEEEIIQTMRRTFRERVETVEEEIDAFDRPLEDIVVMASILEAEASRMEDRRTIAGVLWKRLEIGMPLQVDAAFVRVNGKTTYELTLDDLAEDDPFNTYTNTGLPPQPITNPGLGALEAAVTPIETDSLYYLADREGNTYYSETLEEHQRKKEVYVN